MFTVFQQEIKVECFQQKPNIKKKMKWKMEIPNKI